MLFICRIKPESDEKYVCRQVITVRNVNTSNTDLSATKTTWADDPSNTHTHNAGYLTSCQVPLVLAEVLMSDELAMAPSTGPLLTACIHAALPSVSLQAYL